MAELAGWLLGLHKTRGSINTAQMGCGSAHPCSSSQEGEVGWPKVQSHFQLCGQLKDSLGYVRSSLRKQWRNDRTAWAERQRKHGSFHETGLVEISPGSRKGAWVMWRNYIQFRACSIPLTSIDSLALISNEPRMPLYRQELITDPIHIYLRTCCLVSAGHTVVSSAVSSYSGLAFPDVPTQQYQRIF